MFKNIVEENGLEAYVQESTFPSWDYLKSEFWNHSQHVKLKRLQ